MINNRIFKTILLASAACYISNNSGLADDVTRVQKQPPATHHHHHKSKTKDVALPHKVWTLETAIQLALQHYPEISGYIAAKRAVEKRIDGAKGGYLPTLDLKATGGYEYTRDKMRNNRINGPVNGTVARHDHYEPSLSLEQPIFDGFETVNQVDKAKREYHQADLKIEETKVLVAYKVAEQYIALRRFQRLLKLAEANVANHRQISSKVETLVKAGKLTIVEREQVLSRLSDAESSLADIGGDVENAIANFVELVGEHPTALAKVNVPFALLPTTLEQALQICQKNNKSLILARATVDVAKSDMKVTQSAFYPKVGVAVDAARRFNTAAKDGTENSLTALLVVRWNLFNGGRDQAKTGEYRERIVQAYHDMQKEQRMVEKEIRVSWGELRSSARQAKALHQAVEAKKQLGDSYTTEFDVGKKSLLDVLDARNESFLAMGSLITADATYDLSALRLMAAAGELPKLFKFDGYVENARTNPNTPSDVPASKPVSAPVSKSDETKKLPKQDVSQVKPNKKSINNHDDAKQTRMIW